MKESEHRPSRPQAVCYQCVHLYITYDKRHPYGCRAMGFKSRRLPEYDVWEATGQACLSFTPK